MLHQCFLKHANTVSSAVQLFYAYRLYLLFKRRYIVVTVCSVSEDVYVPPYGVDHSDISAINLATICWSLYWCSCNSNRNLFWLTSSSRNADRPRSTFDLSLIFSSFSRRVLTSYTLVMASRKRPLWYNYCHKHDLLGECCAYSSPVDLIYVPIQLLRTETSNRMTHNLINKLVRLVIETGSLTGTC